MIETTVLLCCAAVWFGWAGRGWYERRMRPEVPVAATKQGNVYFLPLPPRDKIYALAMRRAEEIKRGE